MLVAADLIVIVLTWLPTLALRQRMAPLDAPPGWIDHLSWGGVLVAGWLLAGRLDPALRRRGPGGFGTVVLRLLAPVVVTGLSPQIAYGLEFDQAVPFSLMLPWMGAVLILLAVVRAVLTDRGTPPPEVRPREAQLAFRSAGLGLVVLAAVPLFPDPREIYSIDVGPFAVAFLRGVVQLTGLLGVAMAVGIGLADGLARLRRVVLGARRWRFLTVTVVLAVAFPAVFVYVVLDHMPHVQDEIAMVFQAKNLAAGRLHAKVPPMIEAFDYEFILADGDRWYGKYFPGPSLLMVPGVWLGATWLVHPIMAGGAILLLFVLARRLFGERIGRVTVLLAAISPFWMMTFASHMAHPGCLAIMLVFAVALVAGAEPSGRWYHAVLAGLALAAGAWFRPLTALALAVPWIVYALVRMVQRRASPVSVPWFLAAAVAGVAPLLAYNKALTGQALLPPFAKAEPTDCLGFGPEVGLSYASSRGHTPEQGLRKVVYRLHTMGLELLGWPRGILLVALTGGLWSVRRRRGALMLAVGAALPIAYFFYHAAGVCYGARYYSEALPAYLILVALGLGVVRRVMRRAMKRRGLTRPARCARASVWALALVSLAGCLIRFVPEMVDEYAHAFWTTDALVRDAVARERLTDAVVFVRSSHYRSIKGGQIAPDYYGAAFWMNSPMLDGEVIFARDLDRDLSRKFPPGTNERVLANFPGRQGYRFIRDGVDRGHLEPLEIATTSRASRVTP